MPLEEKKRRQEKKDFEDGVKLQTGYKHTVTVVERHRVHVLEFEDVLFHHNSAVMMPDRTPGTADQDRITGLGVVVAAYYHARSNDDQKLLLAGHTDTSGGSDYNEKLSKQRAEDAQCVIEGTKDPWVDIALDKGKVEDYQQILAWVAATQLWPCDPGGIDNQNGPKTKAAVKAFQEHYSKAEFGTEITADGVVGKQTWGAFFEMYMHELQEMTDTDAAGLDELRGKITWLYDDRKFVGCGEYHPIDQPYLQNRRSQANRRVELLFYEPGEEPKKKPGEICHEGGKDGAEKCKIYSAEFYDYEYIDFEGAQAMLTSCAVVENANAGNASDSHQAPDDPEADIDRENLYCFAPGTDEVSIAWDIDNPDEVFKLTFELYAAADRKTALWTEEHKGDAAVEIAKKKESTSGGGHTGSRDWKNVKLEDEEKFPDGVLTVEHAPYQLRVKVTSGTLRKQSVAWTYFDVVVADLELELGEKAVLGEDRDKALYDVLLGEGTVQEALPAASATKKVQLLSNIYKTSGGEMNDNTAFTEYESAWGDGPNVPVFAMVWIKNVKGEKVEAPKALGKVKFLWDWEDTAEDLSNQGAKPKAFLEKALDYYKEQTKPKGDNCHDDRGGKRGKDGKPVFPAQDGYAPADSLQAGKFPFKVEACTKRKWAALSEAWTDKKLAGKTGVVFQPSRMSGDGYKLTVYLADEKKDDKIALDVEDDAPLEAGVKKSTGTWRIWREIHIVRYILKDSSIDQFVPDNIEDVRGYFRDAFIQAEDKMDADNQYELDDHRKGDGSEPDYNDLCRTAISNSGDGILTNDIGVDPNADHAGASSTFLIRTYADFKTELASFLGSNAAANTWMANNGYDTEAKYKDKMEDSLADQIDSVVAGLEILAGHKDGASDEAADGVTIIHFDGVHQLGGGLLGMALDIPGESTRNRCGFLFWRTRLDTFVHEVGHHLFMPHAHGAPGTQADKHDAADTNCLMSYNRPRPDFCGLCNLRLRGYDATKLKKNAADNKKP
jgi:hypothetical protein